MTDDEPALQVNANADELVVRAKSDRTAFGQLYERYYSEVSRYCLRRLLVRTIAEDVISDVFLQIASHLPLFPGRTETDFRRWLFRIATNAINAHWRQSHRRRELFEQAARSGLFATNGSLKSTEEADWPEIYRVIDQLDERDRTIVTLRFFSECTHEEIASIVDSKPGAVRTALSRILAKLRTQLKQTDSVDAQRGSPPAG